MVLETFHIAQIGLKIVVELVEKGLPCRMQPPNKVILQILALRINLHLDIFNVLLNIF